MRQLFSARGDFAPAKKHLANSGDFLVVTIDWGAGGREVLLPSSGYKPGVLNILHSSEEFLAIKNYLTKNVNYAKVEKRLCQATYVEGTYNPRCTIYSMRDEHVFAASELFL